MKLLFIFTGGTIGSALQNGYIDLDRDKPYKLIEAYRGRYGIDFEYDTIEPVNFLSENSTGSMIRQVVSVIAGSLQKDYDGIIVTHGTDTLQYTAAAAGYALGCKTVPVCFVSADKPVEEPASNGLINLHHAICFIHDTGYEAKPHHDIRSKRTAYQGGVWVVYRNAGSVYTHVHRAARLLAHSSFSSALHSIRDTFYGIYDDDDRFTVNPAYAEKPDEIPTLSVNGLEDICGSVLRILVYPGMPVPYISEEVRHIVIEAYHSGTINTVYRDYERFFNNIYERGIRVWLAGAADDAAYASTVGFERLHITPVPYLAPIALYMKLWMIDSMGSHIGDNLYGSLGGDII